jgi:hypothetical protein
MFATCWRSSGSRAMEPAAEPEPSSTPVSSMVKPLMVAIKSR